MIPARPGWYTVEHGEDRLRISKAGRFVYTAALDATLSTTAHGAHFTTRTSAPPRTRSQHRKRTQRLEDAELHEDGDELVVTPLSYDLDRKEHVPGTPVRYRILERPPEEDPLLPDASHDFGVEVLPGGTRRAIKSPRVRSRRK